MGLKNNELDLDKLEQIADILWLSKYIDKVEVIEVDNNIIDDSNNSSNDSSSQDETDIEEEEEREEEITSNDEQTTKSSSDASLYTNDKKNNQPTNIKADPIKAPKKLSMSSYRDWEKCFKLLRHKVDSKKEFLLDEEETVETIARTHLYQPVFRAKKINYFDLIMIIDKNDSMEVWSELVNEFQKTIQRFGVFRQIYFYYMLSNQEDVKLFADKNMQREVSYKKLNLNGRTLVTVVSDCVSIGWHNNQIFSMIELWSERSSTSIVQMFPKRMWQGTSLYKGLQTSFSSVKFNPLNKHLKSDEDEFYDEEEKTLNIPVINFDPRSFESWGNVILGKRKKWIDGILLEDIEVLEKLDLISEEQEITAEERVDRYFSQASPLAQKLAIYASLLPINFHVIRILQELQLPDSTQIHLAEFFLGGLIKRDISEIDGKKVVSYSFYSDQVQEMLRGMLANPTAYSIQKKMSSFVATHINSSLDFQALMDNPESISGLYLNEEDIAFVKLRAETLRGLGGQYAKRAEILMEGIIEKEEEDEFDNLTFNIHDFSLSIILIKSKENRSFGTGFVIHQDNRGSYILTGAHIIEGLGQPVIDEYDIEIIYQGSSNGLDLAVLYVKGLFRKPLKLENKDFSNSHVQLIGYASYINDSHSLNKVEGMIIDNKITITDKYNQYNFWDIDINTKDYLSVGQGGAPLISKETGRVIGVITNRITNGKKGYAISVEYLKDVWTNNVPLFVQKLNVLELTSSNSFFSKHHMHDSLVLIQSKNKKNNSFGTGFIIHTDNYGSYVVTCAHIIEHIGTPIIQNYKTDIKVLGSSSGIDLAVLYVEGLFGTPFECQNENLENQDIELMGYSPFKKNSYQKRVVFGKVETEKIEIVTDDRKYTSWLIETSGTLENGMNGTPIISKESGKILGIFTDRKSNGKEGYAISIEHLKDIWIDKEISFLEKLNPFKLTSSNSFFSKHHMHDSLVLIQSKNKKNNSFGTGFIIHTDNYGSYVVTTTTVIDAVENIKISNYNVKIVAMDSSKNINLSVLYIKGLYGKIFELDTDNCLSQDVEFLGYTPFRDIFKIERIQAIKNKDNFISTLKENKKINFYHIRSKKEDSFLTSITGSPLLCNKSKKVIGVISLMANSKNEGYAIPIENLTTIWDGMSKELIDGEISPNKKDLEKTVDELLSNHLGLILSRKYDDDFYLRKEIRDILIIKGFELKILNIKKNNFDLIEEIKKIFEINENDLSFESQLDKKIKSITKKTILIIENYDFIDIKIEERFISLLMTLTSNDENFSIIMFGGKELAKYVYGSFDREYFSNANVFFIEDINNPIDDNISNEIKNITGMNPRLIQLYVDNKIENKTSNEYKNFLISSNIMKELFENISSMNQLKQYLEKDNFGFYNPGIRDEFISELFWENLLKEENGRMVWRSDFIKEMGKKLLSQTFSYQITKGVENPSMFFGREKIIKNITQKTPRNYLIVGARRVGKSSLLKALHRTYLKNKTVKSFYFTLADSNLKKKIIDELTPSDKDINSFSELKLYLKQQDKKYVCLIDEVDDFIEYDKNRNYEFLKSLREMSEEGYISFVLAGFWQLYQSKFDHQSPLLNFGDFIEIGELEHDACYDLIKKPMSMMNIVFEEDSLIDDIVSKLGHKAYLISLISIELLEDKISIDGKENALITKKDVARVFKNSKKIRTELVQWVKLEDDKKGELLRRLIMYGMLKNDFFELEDVQKFLKNHDIYIYLSDVEYHLELLVLSFFFKKETYSYSFRIPLQRELLLEDNIDMQIREAVFSLKREDI